MLIIAIYVHVFLLKEVNNVVDMWFYFEISTQMRKFLTRFDNIYDRWVYDGWDGSVFLRELLNKGQ